MESVTVAVVGVHAAIRSIATLARANFTTRIIPQISAMANDPLVEIRLRAA